MPTGSLSASGSMAAEEPNVVYKLYVHLSIAAVVWALSDLMPSPCSCPLTLIGCMSNISWPTSTRVMRCGKNAHAL